MTQHAFGFDWDGCLGGCTFELKAQDINWVINRHKNLWAWIKQIIGDAEGIYIGASARRCFYSESSNSTDKGPSFPVMPELEAALASELNIKLKFSPYLCTDHYYYDRQKNDYIANPDPALAGQTFNAIKTATENFTVPYDKVSSMRNPILNRSSYVDKTKVLMALMQAHYLHSLRTSQDEPLVYHFLDDMYVPHVFNVLKDYPQLIPPGIILDCVPYDADFNENATEGEINHYNGFQTKSIGQIVGTATEADLQDWPARIKILMKLTDQTLDRSGEMTSKIFAKLMAQTDEILSAQKRSAPSAPKLQPLVFPKFGLQSQKQQRLATKKPNLLTVETENLNDPPSPRSFFELSFNC